MNKTLVLRIGMGLLVCGGLSLLADAMDIAPHEKKGMPNEKLREGTLFFKTMVSEKSTHTGKPRLEVPVLFVKTENEEYSLINPSANCEDRNNQFMNILENFGYYLRGEEFPSIKSKLENKKVKFIKTGKKGSWGEPEKKYPIAKIINIESNQNNPKFQSPNGQKNLPFKKRNLKENDMTLFDPDMVMKIKQVIIQNPALDWELLRDMGYDEVDIAQVISGYGLPS